MSAIDKTCKRCGQAQTLDGFAVAPTCADGHDTVCKACRRIEYAERRKAIKSGAIAAGGIAQTPGSVSLIRFDRVTACADCERELGRNRAVFFDGAMLCSECRWARVRGSPHDSSAAE